MKKLILIVPLLFYVYANIKGQTRLKQFKSVSEMYETENGYVFAGENQESGSEIWVTDGSAKGTVLLMDIYPGYMGSQPQSFLEFNGKVYFSANHPKFGNELWVTDGTREGTMIFMDVQDNDEAYKTSSNATPLFTFEDGFVFKADKQANSSYKNIWFSDGTAGGSRILAYGEYGPTSIFAHNDSVYISRGNVLKQAYFGTKTEHVFRNSLGYFRTFSKGVFFATYTTYQSEIWLWFRESNTGKLTELKAFAAGAYGSLEIDNVTKVGNKVFFSLRYDPHNEEEREELWMFDVDSQETKLVKTFSWERHMSGSHLNNFREVNGKLCFIGPSSSNRKLWITDGTLEGTFELETESVYTESGLFCDPDKHAVYFFASNSWGDKQVYRSNGSNDGTARLLRSKFKVDQNSKLCGLINDDLFFLAEKNEERSLWSTQPAAQLRISKSYIDFWDVDVDSMVVGSFKIYNDGNSMLALSEVNLIGHGFFLNDSLPGCIAPGENVSLNVIFFPVESGRHDGILRIKSNDSYPLLEIRLTGNAVGEYKREFSANADSILRKALIQQPESVLVSLDNNEVEEGNEQGELVGNFVSNNSSSSYSNFQLVSGDGDTDNDEFSIAGRQLFAKASFDFEEHSTKLIRIKYTSSDQQEHEQNLVLKITDKQEQVITKECQTYWEALTYGLYDVAFNGKNGLFAVGDQGHIIQSRDFGQTWGKIEFGYKGRLRKITFTSDNIGYILPEHNYLFKTEDGGFHWSLIELPLVDDYQNLLSLFFVNDEIGFVSDDDGYLYKTVDGGRTWSYDRVGYDGISCFHFFNENKGIAFSGNSFYSTKDAGETWISDTSASFGSGTRIKSVSFADEQNGFAIDRDAQIYKTTDQGKTWFKSYKLPDSFGQGVVFPDKDTGYAFAGWFAGKLFKTKDGGVSWHQISTQGFNETINGIAFPGESSICVVGSTGFGSTFAEGRTISISNDEGANWEKVCKIVHDEAYRMVMFPTEKIGYVTCGDLLYKTTDGGICWGELSTHSDFSDMNIEPLNKDTLVAWDRKKIIRSFDDGGSWQTAKSLPEEGYWSNHFNANGYFFYVIKNKIVYSKNYGDDWQAAKTNVSNYQVYYVDFMNSNLGYAFGDDWLKTTDGGENWVKITAPEGFLHSTVCFVGEKVLYAGGQKGLLSKTEDGGRTWKTLQPGHLGTIHDIFFFNELEGVHSVKGGGYYSTVDGGENWSGPHGTSGGNFYLGPDNTLYMTGAEGKVLKVSREEAPLEGTILGNDQVCTNEPHDYKVSTLPGTFVDWLLPDNVISEIYGSEAVLTFPEPGVYELSANLVNNCGTSPAKAITITVGAENQLSITGKNNVIEGENDVNYLSDGNANCRYSWGIEGGKIDVQEKHAVSVSWGNAGKGSLKVFEINTGSQCRSYASLDVRIESKSGIREDWEEQFSVYPNPVSTILSIDLPLGIGQDPSLQLSSLTGKILWHKKLNDTTNSITLNVESLPAGVYLLEIRFSPGTYLAKKIVVVN